MLVKTRYFGTQEIDPQSIIFFPEGIPGFEDCHRFKLFHDEGERPVIHYLQSLDDPSLTFSVVEPYWLGLDYELTFSQAESMILKFFPNKKSLIVDDAATNQHNFLVLIILSGATENGKNHSNIRPLTSQPLIINPLTRRGIQLQLNKEDFDTIIK